MAIIPEELKIMIAQAVSKKAIRCSLGMDTKSTKGHVYHHTDKDIPCEQQQQQHI